MIVRSTCGFRRATRGLLTAAALAGTASCGTAPAGPTAAGAPHLPSDAAATSVVGRPSVACAGFALSLVSDRDGQLSPVAAAEWAARYGRLAPWVPVSGWQDSGRDETGALVRSGNVTLHAIEGTAQTWQVDSGRQC